MIFTTILSRRAYFPDMIFLITLTLLIALVAQPPQISEAMWFFQTLSNSNNQTYLAEQQLAARSDDSFDSPQSDGTQKAEEQGGYSQYGSNLLSIAGIRPSSIASLLNTVGDTGFRYFNIQDQCRNRAACDLGFMLYKKLSYVHNWLIRISVSSLTDMTNVYTQSWMDGMMGRNCTAVYYSCHQSPLDGIMNLGVLQQLIR